jgi:2-haloacid dehalogenase
LAILTNGIKEVQRGRFYLSPIKKYIEALGCRDKGKILMIGDSLSSDIQGGVNFGIDTCWVNLSAAKNPTSLRPTYEVHDLKKLETIL